MFPHFFRRDRRRRYRQRMPFPSMIIVWRQTNVILPLSFHQFFLYSLSVKKKKFLCLCRYVYEPYFRQDIVNRRVFISKHEIKSDDPFVKINFYFMNK